MRDRELLDLMTQAARRAALVAVAAGHSLGSQVVKDSAFAAADEVYRRERPEDFAPKPAPPVALPETPPDDPVKARLDRDVSRETSDDDVPF